MSSRKEIVLWYQKCIHRNCMNLSDLQKMFQWKLLEKISPIWKKSLANLFKVPIHKALVLWKLSKRLQLRRCLLTYQTKPPNMNRVNKTFITLRSNYHRLWQTNDIQTKHTIAKKQKLSRGLEKSRRSQLIAPDSLLTELRVCMHYIQSKVTTSISVKFGETLDSVKSRCRRAAQSFFAPTVGRKQIHRQMRLSTKYKKTKTNLKTDSLHA